MSLTLAETDAGPIPDVAEPVEAWRVWRVGISDGSVVLKSLFSATVWEPTVPLAAVCSSVQRSRWRAWRVRAHVHTAPALGCRCGIYGVQTVSAARQYLDCAPFPHRDDRVIGRVALWGDVVEGTLGWRASYAYPVELFVQDPTGERFGFRGGAHVEKILLALEAYRVPVDLVAPTAIAAC
jgi:hypothetical protein